MELSVIELERRDLLSAGVTLRQGVLSVLADNQGDYLVVQNPNPQTVEVLVASEAGKTYDFPSAQVRSLNFQGGNGSKGDYFANLTALPSTQRAGNNSGVNYLQGGTGNDTLVGSPNAKATNYLTDLSGSNTFLGGAGFNNFFAGTGSDSFTTGPGYNALYSIQATVNIINASKGRGYLIVNVGAKVTADANYQIVTFFKPGVSGNAPGNPGGPSAIVGRDVNGNQILYLNQASGQSSTSFVVNPTATPGVISVSYTDSSGRNLSWAFANISWIASFGPAGSNNTEINNTAVNDVFYGGLPPGNHLVIGGFGINVLKGHSGNNALVGRGVYNDLTAGTGTDVLINQHFAPVNAIFAQAGDILRTNQKTVSSRIYGFQRSDTVSGVPLSIDFATDNDSDATADNQDYAFWALFLQQRKSI